ncbi:MAG: hypothetical protein GQ541_07200 [Desulfovibrionaceae bacterium]|nr:hypothetical protein [Desulfovibrionaceae bacterium]
MMPTTRIKAPATLNSIAAREAEDAKSATCSGGIAPPDTTSSAQDVTGNTSRRKENVNREKCMYRSF